MLNFQKLDVETKTTAIYLLKLESIIRDLEEQKNPMFSFVLEHYQYELSKAAIHLADGPNATKDGRLEAAEWIKAAISEIHAEAETESGCQ